MDERIVSTNNTGQIGCSSEKKKKKKKKTLSILILQNFPFMISSMNTWKVNIKIFLKCSSLLAYEK